MPLSNGRAIKLTTSRYFTPSGVSISGAGITPDIVLADAAQAAQEPVSPPAPAPADAAADEALGKALDMLKHGPALQTRSD
jgi:carboxyl-terminal processing protease